MRRFDILVRSDASSSNTLVKLDGGIDLNSQMGLGPTNYSRPAPTNFLDLRDNPPGYADDVFLGYEQTAFHFRNGPEKFAAQNIAEQQHRFAWRGNLLLHRRRHAATSSPVPATAQSITNQTATWVYHDPDRAVTVLSQYRRRNPAHAAKSGSRPVGGHLWSRLVISFKSTPASFITPPTARNPEGAFGVGKGTTQVVQGSFVNHDSATANIDWWKGTIPAQPNGTQVRYKVALFNGGSVNAGQSILPISDAETTGAKLYGLNQAAITNFNPTTAVVWLHNDLNPANTVIGLQSGFHILRARTFLPRAGQSSVYNTFSQTFYYDGGLPTGTIAYPNNGDTIGSASYTVVVRADSSVTGVDFNIQDSYPGNDDTVTGASNGNGNSNGVPVFVSATAVSPDPNISAQYPNYPQEYRFNYVNVPASGTAAITVRLKTFSTGVYTNRLTTLTSTVNTLGPLQYVEISSPAADGTVISMNTNTTYAIQTCFTASLTATDTTLFSIYINGVLQPQSNYIIQASGCGYGMRSLSYNWTAGSPGTVTGTNVIQVVYSNSVTSTVLSDTRTVVVAPPLRISGLDINNQLVIWDSALGVNYQVLATTNLAQPFTPISGNIPGTGTSTFFFDNSTTNAPQKFYEIEVVP